MEAVTHLEKVIVGEVSAVTHLEKVIAGETSAVTYTEKVITGEAPPITHLQKVIAGIESPVTHLEYVWTGGTPSPTEHEYTGAVPYTFRADGSPLMEWRISGNTVQSTTPTPDNPIMPVGTGERTGNLFDESTIEVGGLDINTGASVANSSRRRSGFIKVTPSTAYTLARVIGTTKSNLWVIGYDANKNAISDSTGSRPMVLTSIGEDSAASSFDTTPSTEYIRWYVTANGSYSNIMLNTGSEALPYEPYGYKIPIISAGQTFDVYIGAEPLRKAVDGSNVADTITYSTQQLIRRVDSSGNALATPTTETIEVPELPTNNGSTTIDVDTALKPSEIYIKYKGV